MNQLGIRAISPDNSRDIQAIIGLLNSRGESAPADQFQRESYWRNHIGSRFISLGAFDGQDLVGHVAIAKSKHSPAYQVLLGVIEQNANHNRDAIAKRMHDEVRQCAAKAGVQNLYFVESPTDLSPSHFGSADFGALPVAALPSLATEENIFPRTVSIVPLAQTRSIRQVFIPRSLSQTGMLLYEQLGLAREVNQCRPEALTQHSYSADRPALSARYFSNCATLEIRVDCGLLGRSSEAIVERVQRSSAQRALCFINLEHPHAESVIEDLMLKGFQWEGILPEYFGYDSGVLAMQTTNAQRKTSTIARSAAV